MNDQTFKMQPFPSAKPIPDLKIAGNIARQGNQFTIHYALLGNVKEVAIAQGGAKPNAQRAGYANARRAASSETILAPSDTPARKHELWKDTCFEFFVGIKNSDQYWEFNLSPAGDWNIYRFDAYRQGMQEETAFTALPFSIQHLSDGLAIALDVDLDKIVPANQAIEVGITTVSVFDDGGRLSAIRH
ncbi:MAG: DOMON-like domain-containing protein [Microcoleus sp. SIO2G3]|nr:DOMON-like domain-containing protein [Microcoleus sp. SIO2G3]